MDLTGWKTCTQEVMTVKAGPGNSVTNPLAIEEGEGGDGKSIHSSPEKRKVLSLDLVGLLVNLANVLV